MASRAVYRRAVSEVSHRPRVPASTYRKGLVSPSTRHRFVCFKGLDVSITYLQHSCVLRNTVDGAVMGDGLA